MNSRRSYFLIFGIVILSIFTGIFIWRNQHHNEIPNTNDKFTAPISSKYIPTNADLIFHWKINPTTLPKFIENNQHKKIKFMQHSATLGKTIDFY